MRYDKKSLFALMLYLLAMLAVCTYAVSAIKNVRAEDNNSVEKTSVSVEYVYVTVLDSTSVTSSEDNFPKAYWKVCEYQGKIGIFLADGTLYDVLDVHIKNLPEADKRMLGEGIIIKNEADLRSIIEDYTS